MTSTRRLSALIALFLLAGAGCARTKLAAPPAGPMPPGATWTGVWDSSFGRLIIGDKPDGVSGVYNYAAGGSTRTGVIRGWKDGNQLRFEWQEQGDRPASGRGVLVMAADGLSFSGTWGTGMAETGGGAWTGTRASIGAPSAAGAPAPSGPPAAPEPLVGRPRTR